MRSAIEREKNRARGIVIRHGAYVHEASAFLAYLWSEESDGRDSALVSGARVPSLESRSANTRGPTDG